MGTVWDSNFSILGTKWMWLVGDNNMHCIGVIPLDIWGLFNSRCAAECNICSELYGQNVRHLCQKGLFDAQI